MLSVDNSHSTVFCANAKRPIQLNSKQIRNTLLAFGYTPKRAAEVASNVTQNCFVDIIKAHAKSGIKDLINAGIISADECKHLLRRLG